MKKAVFLDRDGTINVEKHYLHKIEEFEFIPGALEALRLLQDAGYLLLILTNQSGIARGYYSEDEFLQLNAWMQKEFYKYGVTVTKVYYCPHLPDAKIERYRKRCTCRKPSLGMFIQAAKEYNIDWKASFSVGDRLRDCMVCMKMGCQGYLIAENEKKEILEEVKQGKYKNIEYAIDLLECAKKIVRKKA